MIIVKVVALRRTLTGVAVVYIQLDVVVGREMQARRLRDSVEREFTGEGYMQIFESVGVRILYFFALAVKGVILVLSALGITGLWLAVFADVGVAVLAVLNAMRTLKGAKREGLQP